MKLRAKKQGVVAGVSQSRWAAYAAAGAASAVACATSAEAVIHVYDVGTTYDAPASSRVGQAFPLAGSVTFGMSHNRTQTSSGVAKFGIFHGASAKFNGFTSVNANNHLTFAYVSKLAAGANIAALPFAIQPVGTLAFGSGATHSQWESPGQGYIGFEFNAGAGEQYGWVSVTTEGTAGDNVFTINSYAYGDVGDVVLAGEVPEPGSLGLLAVGGAGLLAWRQRRALASRKPARPA